MSRNSRLVFFALAALPCAYFCALASAAREVAEQDRNAWVLHKPHSDLADGYDPHRDPEKDLATAKEEARKSNRNILVVVGGDWCSWCHTMDQFFHEHPDLETLRDKNYVYMKVSMSQENRNRAFLSRFPRIPAFPHILILADTGTLIRSQSTGELENGRSYSEPLFKKFFEQFAPKSGQ